MTPINNWELSNPRKDKWTWGLNNSTVIKPVNPILTNSDSTEIPWRSWWNSWLSNSNIERNNSKQALNKVQIDSSLPSIKDVKGDYSK